MTTWKDYAKNVRDSAYMLGGLVPYFTKGKTPMRSYYSMLNLHSRTNGTSTNYIVKMFKLLERRGTLNFGTGNGIFSQLTTEQRHKVLEELRTEGTTVLPFKMPKEMCLKIKEQALKTPAFSHDLTGKKSVIEEAPNLNDVSRSRFTYDMKRVVSLEGVQQLMGDRDLHSLMQEHFKFAPTVDLVMMWWSSARIAEANHDYAQLFHFDYDRPKWIKLFVYLTDVGPKNGPHVYVKHSHIADERRARLLSRGYVRLTDEEILQEYRPDEIVSHVGEMGTMILEDTSGFHKGQMLAEGMRLILDMQFSTTTFGADYPKVDMPATLTPELKQMYSQFPSAYKLFKK